MFAAAFGLFDGRLDERLDPVNRQRPHEALGQCTPAERYTASRRPYPRRLPALEYPAQCEVRRVSRNGGIRWKNHWVNVSHVLAEEYIAFRRRSDAKQLREAHRRLKTTIARLLLRFYRPQKGSILLGGVPLAQIRRRDLSRAVSYVAQDVFLKVHRGLPYFRGEARLSTWIYRKHFGSQAKYDRRLEDLTVHEFGHTLGLDHCPTNACVMRDAGTPSRSV